MAKKANIPITFFNSLLNIKIFIIKKKTIYY